MKIHRKISTNELIIDIPDNLKGIELQIIILPLTESNNEQIVFFSEEALENLSAANSGNLLKDPEDYSKW